MQLTYYIIVSIHYKFYNNYTRVTKTEKDRNPNGYVHVISKRTGTKIETEIWI